MIKKIVKTILLGRKNGFRSKIFSTNIQKTGAETFESQPVQPQDIQAEAVSEAPKTITPPEGYEVVSHIDSLKEGEIKEVIIGGEAIAIAKTDGKIIAFENDCPHAGGPLSEGECHKGQIVCPYHGWVFDTETGNCFTNPSYGVKIFDVLIQDEAICVRL